MNENMNGFFILGKLVDLVSTQNTPDHLFMTSCKVKI